MRRVSLFAGLLLVVLCANAALGISISDLRQSGTAGTVDQITGVVVMNLEHMDYHMGRLHIQDASGQIWGGIAVVDEDEWSGTGVLARGVSVGDSVTLYNVEYVPGGAFGNDAVYFSSSSTFSVTPDVGVPAAVELTPDQIFGGAAANVGAEYQSMRVTVKGVSIEQMDIGKKDDNYALVNYDGEVAWAADYANSDKQYVGTWWKTRYHHYTCPDTPEAVWGEPYYNPISGDGYGGVRQHFASISGIMEKSENLPTYECYQLLTVDSNDFQFAIPGDANDDGAVDGSDATILANNWQMSGATWWDGDFNKDGTVDGSDATILASHWMEGVNPTPNACTVPEPQTLTLIATLLLMSFGAWFRNRRSR